MKPVADLRVNLTRLGVMCSAEGRAVIEQEAAVRQVESGYPNGDAFGKTPGYGQIECSVPFQVRPGDVTRPVGEPRAVVNIAVGREARREGQKESRVQRVALIVVQLRSP